MVKLAPHFSGRIFYAKSICHGSLVAKKRIRGMRVTKRNSYDIPVTDNVLVTGVLTRASHREAISVGAAIANQLQMA
jgi:hypothetical protein